MYRLLHHVRERTRRRDHPRQGYRKPELLAKRPNQLWSWDITKRKGPATWTYFYRYVITDVYSRSVVGWMLATRERAELAEALIAETCAREGIAPGQLTVHADQGSAMRAKQVAQLLVDLEVAKSHSRPHYSGQFRAGLTTLIWRWRKATAGPTCPTTTRFPRPRSKPRSIG